MFSHVYTIFHEAVGLEIRSFTPLLQMIIRGFIVYLFGLTLARFNKKLIGIRTPFNFILFIMLGSIFANAILDAKFFIPTLTTILFLTLLNGSITALAYYFPLIELFVKGSHSILVKNGEIQWKTMEQNFITEIELFNELQRQMHTRSLKNIEAAILTSDGAINFIEKKEHFF